MESKDKEIKDVRGQLGEHKDMLNNMMRTQNTLADTGYARE